MLLNVSVYYAGRPLVCPVDILAVTHQGAACDAASVHFSPTISRTDILVLRAAGRHGASILQRITASRIEQVNRLKHTSAALRWFLSKFKFIAK